MALLFGPTLQLLAFSWRMGEARWLFYMEAVWVRRQVEQWEKRYDGGGIVRIKDAGLLCTRPERPLTTLWHYGVLALIQSSSICQEICVEVQPFSEVSFQKSVDIWTGSFVGDPVWRCFDYILKPLVRDGTWRSRHTFLLDFVSIIDNFESSMLHSWLLSWQLQLLVGWRAPCDWPWWLLFLLEL